MKSNNLSLNSKFNYLSLDFEGNDQQQIILNTIILDGLIILNNEFKIGNSTDELIKYLSDRDFTKIENELNFKFPHKGKSDHWHLTTFFKKNKQNLTEKINAIINEFELNKEVPVNVFSFVYIPDKILILSCNPQCNVDNKYPHITCLVKDVKPVFSNTVLETIFSNNNDIKNLFEDFIENPHEYNVEKKPILKHLVLNSIDLNQEDCYMCIYEKEKFILHGKMLYNF